MVKQNSGLPIQAIGTSFAILGEVRDRNGAGVTEIATELNLAKSAVYKHLMSMTRLGFLVKDGTTYHISLTFQGFGDQARKRYSIHGIEPAIDNLAGTTGKVASYMVYENGFGIYAYQACAKNATGPPAKKYTRVPLHATAGGKAILACLPTEDRDEIVNDNDLSSYTEKTITNSEVLQDELQSIRDRRIAFEREEFVLGYQCVGSPITNPKSDSVAAVSVSGSTNAMKGKRLEEDTAGLVLSAAKSIENQILST